MLQTFTSRTNPGRAIALAGMLVAAPAVHAAQATVPVEELDAFLSLPRGSLSLLSPSGISATRGSAMRQSISAAAGDTLSFDYLFATNEGKGGANNNVIDFAFVTVTAPTVLAQVLYPVDPAISPVDPAYPLERSALVSPITNVSYAEQLKGGYQKFEVTFAVAGDYVLGVGVLDVEDELIESALLVDNFVFTRNPGANRPVDGVLPASGPVVANPSFESLLDGWATFGIVNAVGNVGIAPTHLNRQALLESGTPPVQFVPVPAAVWLLGSALAALGLRCRRRAT